jgi:hypothetical protein
VIEIPTLTSTDLSLSSNKQAGCKGCFWEKKFQRQKQLRKQFHILGQVHKLCSVCTKLAYVLESESKVKEQSCQSKNPPPKIRSQNAQNSQPERRSRTTPCHHYHQNSFTIYQMFLVFQVHKLFSASTKPSQSKSMQHCIHGLFFCCNLRWKAQSKVKEQSSKPKFTQKNPSNSQLDKRSRATPCDHHHRTKYFHHLPDPFGLIFKCTNLFSLKPHET